MTATDKKEDPEDIGPVSNQGLTNEDKDDIGSNIGIIKLACGILLFVAITVIIAVSIFALRSD